MQFRPGTIEGVIWRPLTRYSDSRGWLCELFRQDELPKSFWPVMAYVSMTEPGVTRGPHEHIEQADLFCFLGPSDFKLYLWDTRKDSISIGVHQVEIVGENRPMAVIVPHGVVHAYRNVGMVPGLVLNCPNSLYKGWGKKDKIDEIRHEERLDTLFLMD